MASEELLVTLGVKDKGATTQIRALNKELKYLDKEFKATSKGSKDFENSTEGLRSKLTHLEKKYEVQNAKLKAYNEQLNQSKEVVAKKEAELEKLKKAEGDNATAIEKTEKQLESYKQKMSETAKNINLTEIEMKNLSTEISSTNEALDNFKINKLKNELREAGEELEKSGERIKKTGQGISDVGGGLMKLSAPILAGSVAIGKLAMDFESGIANINTLLEDTSNLDGYKNKIIELSNETGISADVMSSGMYQAISSLGDLGKETEEIFEVMAKSSKAGGAETADSVALISSAMKGYGSVSEETAQKVSDLAFTTARLGVTTFPEMASAMAPLFPLSSTLSVSLEELFSNMATLTGVTGNTSEVTTQLKAVMSNLIKPTKDMSAVIEKYGYANSQAMIESEGWAGLLQIIQTETGGSADEMGKLFSSTEALTAIMALCGANYEDFISKSAQMNNALGATDTALEKVSDTSEDRLNKSMNKLKNTFIESGEKLTPLIDSLSEGIEKVADALSEMDPEMVTTIAKIGLFTMATGGALKGIGGLTQGVGSLVSMSGKGIKSLSDLSGNAKKLETASKLASSGGIGKLAASMLSLNPVTVTLGASLAVVAGGVLVAKTNADLMNNTILDTKEEMNGLEKVLLNFNGVQAKSRKELEDTGLVYKDFNENISDEFKTKVEENTKSINDFALYLKEINFDGVIDEQETAEFTNRIDNTIQSAIDTINSKQSESNEAMMGLFMNDNIIDDNEQKILDFFTRNAETSRAEVETLGDEIKALQLQINETKNVEEIAQLEELIKEKYNRIKEIELQFVGSNAEEIAYAKNEFNARVNSIDLQGASDIMKEKAKLRDDEIVNIKATYDTQIDMMKANLSGMEAEERKAAEDKIEIWELEKNEKIRKENAMYNEYLDIIGEKNPEILAELNKYSGDILNNSDKMSKDNFEIIKSHYDDLNKVTEDGTYKLYNKQSRTWDDVVVKIDEATGEVVGVAKLATENINGYFAVNAKDIAGYTSDIEKSMEREAGAIALAKNKIVHQLLNARDVTISTNGDIVDSNGNVIVSLDEMGDATYNAANGILNINGTPIKVQVDNKNGTIQNLQEIIDQLAKIQSKNITVKTNMVTTHSAYAEGTDNAKRGVGIVAEEGPELIFQRGKVILTDDSGPQLFNFEGGERVLTATETKNLLTTGGYYNPSSVQSRDLARTVNLNKGINTNNSLDVDKLINGISTALITAIKNVSIQGDVILDNKALVGQVSRGLAVESKGRR